MDERTEELRDLFVEVTDADTVTESQQSERGSLADADDEAVGERIAAVIERMRDRYAFATDLPTPELVAVARGFFDGRDDPEIAAVLDADPETVFRARLDLHLVDEDDAGFPFDLATLREHRKGVAKEEDGDPDVPALADALDADPETVERALAVADARAEIRRASGRFRSEFEDAIPDAALSVRLTEATQEHGLREAAEDIETDTQF